MHNGNFYRHGGGVELNLSSSGKYALALGQFLTLIRAAMKIDVAVRLEVIYDFSATNRREGRRYVMTRP